MKVTVIGMWGGFPKVDEPCSGYLIEHNEEKVLLDCGSGVAVKIGKYMDVNTLRHIVVSHSHYDHASDIGVMMFSRLVNTITEKTDVGLTIYEPYNEISSQHPESVKFSEFKSYEEDSVLKIGDMSIRFLEMNHPVKTYAMKISTDDKTVVYTADGTISEELKEFSQGADLLITECSLYEWADGVSTGHMNITDCIELVKDAGVKETILTHLPHYGEINYLLETAKQSGIENVQLAQPGLTIEV